MYLESTRTNVHVMENGTFSLFMRVHCAFICGKRRKASSLCSPRCESFYTLFWQFCIFQFRQINYTAGCCCYRCCCYCCSAPSRVCSRIALCVVECSLFPYLANYNYEYIFVCVMVGSYTGFHGSLWLWSADCGSLLFLHSLRLSPSRFYYTEYNK